MPERCYRPLLYALALTGLLADQASKYGVFAWLAERPLGPRYTLYQSPEPGEGFALEAQYVSPASTDQGPTWFAFLRDANHPPHVNHGALFGFLKDYQTLANLTFALVSLAAAAGIIWWSRQPSTARDPVLCAALGLILAGTLGNLYDRLVFNGVRDFLHWNYLYDWPVFNIADCCLVLGASLMLLQAFFGKSAPVPADARNATTSAPLTAEVAASPHVTTGPKAEIRA
jgi:lipoprotein signal peptidase